jgi:predicted metalloprotease
MRWRRGRRSDNVEDRRGDSGSGLGGGAGLPLLPLLLRLGGRKGGIGTILVVVALIYFLGGDLGSLLGGLTGTQQGVSPTSESRPPQQSASEQELADFVSVVLGYTEDTWHSLFREHFGKAYREPTLVLFHGATGSACGQGLAATGPFYCPADEKVYIDLGFYDQLRTRFRAPGDAAQAYVIAHEVGHHVQNLLGISSQVRQAQQGLGQNGANQLSVRLELQADCLAGIWAHHADRAWQVLEAGDVEEALGAASATGDDRLQKQARGYVTPDTFTHGTSAQRARWFRRGLESGAVEDCDTFAAEEL